jgi:hypothetical protein
VGWAAGEVLGFCRVSFICPFATAVTINRRRDLFHPPSPEPCWQLFEAHGSPVAGFAGVWLLVSHLPHSFSFRSTCHPSPCGRLSRPRTTTMTPSPWGSRPLGDLEFLRIRTYQHDLGLLLIPTPGLYGPVSHRMGSLRLKTEVEVLDDIVNNRSRDGEEPAPIGIRIQTIQS